MSDLTMQGILAPHQDAAVRVARAPRMNVGTSVDQRAELSLEGAYHALTHPIELRTVAALDTLPLGAEVTTGVFVWIKADHRQWDGPTSSVGSWELMNDYGPVTLISLPADTEE